MARHRQPSLTAAVLWTALVVLVCLALLVLLVPQLPAPVIYRPDVRAPVRMPGPSFIPMTAGP